MTLSVGKEKAVFAVGNGMAPVKGCRTLPQKLTFPSDGIINFDLTLTQLNDALEFVQSFYYDNSANTSDVSLAVDISNQVLILPAGTQGYLPIIAPGDTRIVLTSVANAVLKLQLLNFPVPAIVWGGSSGGSSGSPVTIGKQGADGSATITTGGTAQNLFSGVTPTNGYGIYNPDPANDLWVSDSTTAAANAAGSIRVPANGGYYETPPVYKPIGAVSIVGATTAQAITARKW